MTKKFLTALLPLVTTIALLQSCTPSQPCPPPMATCDTVIHNWKHFIPKETAQAYIDSLNNWRKNGHPLDANNLAVSHLYDSARDMMRNMMLRDSCIGMRVYYGLNPQGRIIPIVCGAKSNGDDIYWRRIMSQPTNLAAKTAQQEEREVDGLCDMSLPEPPQNAVGTMR